MVAPRLLWLVSIGTIAYCYLLGTAPSAADSILAGTVIDAVYKQPVAGAEVQIEYSGQKLGAGTTDIDGHYRVPFTIPPATSSLVTMSANARSGSHEVNFSSFQVRDGTPIETTHNIELYPAGVTACRSKTSHSVIVGHFLAPLGRDLADLSWRVAQSLEFALNTRLQTVRLNLDPLPSFEPCPAAKPRTPRFGANFAEALRADAFVGGNIAASVDSPSFRVSIYVSDAHGLLSNPVVASNRSVDLDSPNGASVAGETHAAVLTSIAAGLAKKNDCRSAIAVLSIAEQLVAEQLVDVIPSYMTRLRNNCQSRVSNAGLRSASP